MPLGWVADSLPMPFLALRVSHMAWDKVAACPRGGAFSLVTWWVLCLNVLIPLRWTVRQLGGVSTAEGLQRRIHMAAAASSHTASVPPTHLSVWWCHLPHVPVPDHRRQPPADSGADGRERALPARAPAVREAPARGRCGQVRPATQQAHITCPVLSGKLLGGVGRAPAQDNPDSKPAHWCGLLCFVVLPWPPFALPDPPIPGQALHETTCRRHQTCAQHSVRVSFPPFSFPSHLALRKLEIAVILQLWLREPVVF